MISQRKFRMFKWSIEELTLPLKFAWNISRNSSTFKNNFIVTVKNGNIEGRGEVAFNVRYNESREQVLEKFEEFTQHVPSELTGIENLVAVLESMDLPQSLKFGIESSFMHYISNLSGKTVPQLLGTTTVNSAPTSFSIPIMENDKLLAFYKENNLERFKSIKVKVNKDNAYSFVKDILDLTHVPLRIDANESFETAKEVMHFIEQMDKLNALKRIEFLEQPLHASNHTEALELKKHSPLILIADESVTKESITEYHAERFHGINMKLMKAGGYVKGLKQLRQAKMLGLKTMIGCMVETSLGISSALHLAGGVDYLDLDGFLLLKEDPFQLVSEENGKVFFAYLQ